MNNENAFFCYLRAKKEVFLIGFLVLVGITLLCLGTFDVFPGSKTENVSYEDAMTKNVENVLSNVTGVGEVQVLILYESDTTAAYAQDAETSMKVVSVTVVCDGGDSAAVRAELTKMLSSFFGIGANRITVLKRKA